MSATQMMILDDFEALAMAYGGELDRWPADEREAAQRLLSESDAARRLLNEARALDATLDLWETPAPSHALVARVLEDAASMGAVTPAHAPAPMARKGWLAKLLDPSGWRLSGPKPAFAMAACLALGFSFGITLDGSMIEPAGVTTAQNELGSIDLAFAMEDDSDLLLGPEAFL